MLAVQTRDLWNEDLLVIAADNVIDFSFSGFVDFFQEKNTSLIMTYVETSMEALRRTGVITLDGDDKVTGMEEKPLNPTSHYAVPPFYIYRKEDLELIKDCLAEASDNLDVPGTLVKFMLGKTAFHSWRMPGHRYDIGTLESYYKITSGC